MGKVSVSICLGPYFPPGICCWKNHPVFAENFLDFLQGISLWTHPGVASVASQLVAFGSFPDFGKNSNLGGVKV